MKPKEFSTIARSYAEALFRAAQRRGILQQVVEDARGLGRVIEQTPSFLVFLQSPQIATEAKLALLGRTLGGGRTSEVVFHLLELLVQRDRPGYLADILTRFLELVEQAAGVFQATVTTAQALAFQERARLKTTLERYAGCQLRIDYQVDPRLIGGVVFRYRDVLIDSSLHSGLEQLRRRMTEKQLLRRKTA